MTRTRRTHRPTRRRSIPQDKPMARPPSRRTTDNTQQEISLNLLRVVICGGIFVLLITLKLLLPGPMTAVRGTLSSWLVRDADFEEAFSAVGRAVSGEKGVVDNLENAYTAVFGPEEAKEVSAPTELEEETPTENGKDDTSDYPPKAEPEQRVLGFAYAAPMDGAITSGFGWREHPVSGRESFHYGVDIGAEEGQEVTCFADGTVSVVGESTELGNYVTVHHENGITTLYGHLRKASVSSGDKLKLGSRIGEAGSTGNATGPHLHFEIHDGEDYLDPVYYLS